jgi:hypothetical protein
MLKLFTSYTTCHEHCRNPNLVLMTKTKVCKGAGREWSLGVTFYSPISVGECEGMSPHTPK